MRKVRKGRLFLILVIPVLFCVSLVYGVTTFLLPEEPAKKEGSSQKVSQKQTTGESSFTFAGVGDNLIHQAVFYSYLMGDTDYDFNQDYALIQPYIEPADLSFINQETICAGEDYGLSNYPQFNGPTQILDAVVNTGFDWLATSSNHSLDKGSEALIAQLDYLHEKYPDVVTTGTHRNEKESRDYVVKNINGIKVGLLGYTYGLNGIPLPEDMPWLVDLIDENQIQKDVEEISKMSDVQIVSMHWGTEYHTEIEPDQKALAQKMNEWGVEVIIGTHPHVIKPAEIIKGEDQDTLCYYSLGNFLSAQESNDNMIGGLASFTLHYDFDAQKTTFSDVKFIPTVTYYNASYTTFQTMTLADYDDNYAASHYVTSLGYDMTREWIQNYVQEVMQGSEGIEVVLKT